MKVGALPPQFGWSRQNPPQYRVTLSRQDFADLEGLKPAPALVKDVAEKLVGDSDETPRFALLTNTLPLLGTPKRVATFQGNLLEAAVTYIERHYPQWLPPMQADGDWLEKMKSYFPAVDVSGGVLHTFERPEDAKILEGYGAKVNEDGMAVESYKALHTDGQSSRIFSLRYGPNVNIRGGRPRVADVRQYRRDNGLDVYDVSSTNGVATRKEHLAPLLKDYTLALDGFDAEHDLPVLFLNNMVEEGVLHGATRPFKKDKSQPATRPITGGGFYYVQKTD